MPPVTKNKQISKKSGKKIPTGGKGMMQGQATGPQKPGFTSQEQGRAKSKGPAKGGTTKMFGKQTAKNQTPA